jgi:hypothetical protein
MSVPIDGVVRARSRPTSSTLELTSPEVARTVRFPIDSDNRVRSRLASSGLDITSDELARLLRFVAASPSTATGSLPPPVCLGPQQGWSTNRTEAVPQGAES